MGVRSFRLLFRPRFLTGVRRYLKDTLGFSSVWDSICSSSWYPACTFAADSAGFESGRTISRSASTVFGLTDLDSGPEWPPEQYLIIYAARCSCSSQSAITLFAKSPFAPLLSSSLSVALLYFSLVLNSLACQLPPTYPLQT